MGEEYNYLTLHKFEKKNTHKACGRILLIEPLTAAPLHIVKYQPLNLYVTWNFIIAFTEPHPLFYFLFWATRNQWNSITILTYFKVQFFIVGYCEIFLTPQKPQAGGSCPMLIQYTGLFEMTVGVLTTCHTQHTWDRSICFLLFNRKTLQVFVTYCIGALYVHPLWFYKHQHDNRVRSKLFVACQRWWFQWRFRFVPSVPRYLQEEGEHKPDPWHNPIERNHMGLHLENEVAVVKTSTIISNNPVFPALIYNVRYSHASVIWKRLTPS